MTSSVVGWPKAHNTRFCTCSLCATMWNVVRVKCVLCSSTEGISYQSIEGGSEHIKAETCDKCRRYVKILYQVNDPVLEPWPTMSRRLGLDMLLPRRAGSAAARTRSCWAIDDERRPRMNEARPSASQAAVRGPGAAHGRRGRLPSRASAMTATVVAIRRTRRRHTRGQARRQRGGDAGRPAIAAGALRLLEQEDAPEPAARLQSHRHGAAHQPRPRRAARSAIAAAVDAMRSAVALEFDIGGRRAASATTTCAASSASSPAPRTPASSTTTPPPCCWCSTRSAPARRRSSRAAS